MFLGLIMALALAGCSGASADLAAKLPDGTAYGRAVFQASTGGGCVNTSVSFGQPDGSGGYKPIAGGNLTSGPLMRTALGHVDLPPGPYHILSVACMMANHSTLAFTGKTDGPSGLFKTPKMLATLGTVDIRAGEVVDIGALSFIRSHSDVARSDSVMIVSDNIQRDLDALRASNPSIAAKLTTRHAKSNATPDDLAATEARLSKVAVSAFGMNKMIVELQLAMVRRAKNG